MKVLSLTEPGATLIKEKKKLIETRSWKTNYRGELYIHASKTKIPKEWRCNLELMSLVNDTLLNYGKIIWTRQVKLPKSICRFARSERSERMCKAL